MTTIRIEIADLENPTHAAAVVELTDHYAGETVAGGRPLDDDVRRRLVDALRRHPTTVVLLAFADEQAVGLATCFLGFSTFAARPLLNIHDLAVRDAWRGQGVGRALLSAVERHARELGCCKVTLEVLHLNDRARRIYAEAGYTGDAAAASAATYFMTKPLA